MQVDFAGAADEANTVLFFNEKVSRRDQRVQSVFRRDVVQPDRHIAAYRIINDEIQIISPRQSLQHGPHRHFMHIDP